VLDRGRVARLKSFVAVVAHVLAELDAQGVTDTEYGLTAASWLAREAAIPGRVARQHVAVGRSLRSLPVVDDAVVGGEISSHHATALAEACNPRVADAVAEIQDEIVGLADHALFETWRRDVRMLISLIDEDGGHDPADDLASNKVRMSESLDGLTHLMAGQLTGEYGLAVRQAIETTWPPYVGAIMGSRTARAGPCTPLPRLALVADAHRPNVLEPAPRPPTTRTSPTRPRVSGRRCPLAEPAGRQGSGVRSRAWLGPKR
jgi:hypothetical protein